MKKIISCRRTFVSVLAICCLTALGIHTGDASIGMAISGVAAALCGANSWEARSKNGK